MTYLTSAVTKIVVTVDVCNYGNSATDKYLIALPQSLDNQLALIEVRDENKERLHLERTSTVDLAAKNAVFYVVDLAQKLAADNGASTVSLKVTTAYIHRLEALPAQIRKSSKQFVVYEGNKHFYSPYKTSKFGSKYSLNSEKIKSFTKLSADML